jgi:predicted PurR-regulated permease PerM
MNLPGPDSGRPDDANGGTDTEAQWARRARQCCVVLAAIAVIAGLHVARGAIAPVLFAVVFALLLSPAVDWLKSHRVPRGLGAALVVLALVVVVGLAANSLWKPAREWLDTAPATMRTLERKLRPLTRFIAKVESVSDQAERMTAPAATPDQEPAPMPVRDAPKGLVESTQQWIITTVTTLMLVYFMLATGPALLARWSDDPRTGMRDRRLLQLAQTVRVELGRYFGAITLSNVILGIGTTLTMFALDMPNPLLWGALAFILNFIPYAGSLATLTLVTIVALVSFEGAGRAVAVAGAYLALTTFEGQVLQPILVGRRLDLSPLFVFLGLWFGGWLWGIAGVALAVPAMVAIKAILNARLQYGSEGSASAVADPGGASLGTLRERTSAWARSSPRWRHRSPSSGER